VAVFTPAPNPFFLDTKTGNTYGFSVSIHQRKREECPMKLGVFVSDYSPTLDTLDRLKSDKLGIFLVQNGVYHAAIRDKSKGSAVLDAAPHVYVLREDLETRGFAADAVDSRARVVGYDDIVDLVFNEYPKIAWL